MKENKWKTAKDIITYIAIIALLIMVVQGCSNRSDKYRQETQNKIASISDGLFNISEIAYSAKESDDYDAMKDALSDIYWLTDKLQRTVDDLYSQFEERDLDDGRESRSWFN